MVLTISLEGTPHRNKIHNNQPEACFLIVLLLPVDDVYKEYKKLSNLYVHKMKKDKIEYNTIQYNTIQYNTILYNTIY